MAGCGHDMEDLYWVVSGGQGHSNHPQHDPSRCVSCPYASTNPIGFAGPDYSRHELPQWNDRILYVGNGTTVAGQSTEDFADRPRVSLCYQCCKRIPLDTLLDTREESCGDNSCRRTKEAGLQFLLMPNNAAEACENFRVFLDWWMEKIDLHADEIIEKRARNRVLEMRDDIP
ncbi:hypothetical protein GGR55DRAFT_684117 [Xylaria sp. FL0064]|nr:hypothetical protein GGR55DRAFT_684117 [Xylaria sp. FL0064]